MLAYVVGTRSQDFMAGLARQLQAEGVVLGGVLERDLPAADGWFCAMEMQVLGCDAPPIPISLDLGPGATSCRLDAGALENATARVLTTLDAAQIVLVNKFGKQEAIGRGMVAVIAEALSRGLPVITCVREDLLDSFEGFAGGFAEPVAPEAALDWCLAAIHKAAA